jgi:group I intron endonuclease
MTGIYKIISPTNKIYIGQSIDIKKRWVSYKRNTNYQYQTRLKNSIEKYGIDQHQFIILEECDINQLNNRERYYQDLYNVLGPNGLNCRLTTSESKSGKNSIESNHKRSLTQKGKSKGPRPDVAIRNKIIHSGKTISDHHKEVLRNRKGTWNHSAESIEKIRIKNKKPKTDIAKLNMSAAWLHKKDIICPHCNKISKNTANMKRWHFDNCKNMN